jgi:hypothetical protein
MNLLRNHSTRICRTTSLVNNVFRTFSASGNPARHVWLNKDSGQPSSLQSPEQVSALRLFWWCSEIFDIKRWCALVVKMTRVQRGSSTIGITSSRVCNSVRLSELHGCITVYGGRCLFPGSLNNIELRWLLENLFESGNLWFMSAPLCQSWFSGRGSFLQIIVRPSNQKLIAATGGNPVPSSIIVATNHLCLSGFRLCSNSQVHVVKRLIHGQLHSRCVSNTMLYFLQSFAISQTIEIL